MPLRLEIRKFVVNRRNVFAVAVSNDKAMTLSELALAVCGSVTAVLRDILSLEDNSHVVDQLWHDYAASKLEILRKKAREETKLEYKNLLDGISAFGEEETRNEVLEHGLRIVVEDMKHKKDVSWKQWKVDLRSLGELLLTPELKQSNWARCRADHSNAKLDETAVKRYIAEIERMKPHLLRAEKLVRELDARCKSWNEGKHGKDMLTTIAALSTASAVTTVYTAQHPQADGISQISNELLAHFIAKGNENITHVIGPVLKKARGLYHDIGFNKALYNYLLNWNWSEHYYFHAVAAKSADLENFDNRLFAAMNRLGEYLSRDPDMGTALANEANAITARIWTDVSRGARRQTAPKKQAEEEEDAAPSPKVAKKALEDLWSTSDSGWLSTLSVWNGYAWTMAGNFDGPPSVLSLMLSRFCANEHFIAQLKNDTLIKKVAMIGFSPNERAAVLGLAKQDNGQLAAKLFKETSWRSKSVFATQGVLSVGLLLFWDIPNLYDAYKASGDRAHFDTELTKRIVALSQSMLNLGLVATSWITSKEMDFFLAKNAHTTSTQISSHLAASSSKTFRVVAVGAMHGAMAFGAIVTSVIDLKDGWGKAGPIQKALLVGATVAPVATLAAIAGSFGMLGPIAFLGGVAIGIVIAGIRWFQPKIEGTLQKLVSVVEDSLSYASHEADSVSLQYLEFKKSKLSVEELLELLEDEISNMDWSSNLDKKYAIDYLIAGVPKGVLAKMYDTSTAAQKQLLHKQSKKLDQQRLAKIAPGVHLMWPSSTKVPLAVGANTLIRVIVAGHSHTKIGSVWIEWNGSPIQSHLDNSLTGYHHDRGVVFLVRRMRTSNVLFYQCRIRLLKPPPVDAKQAVELPLRLHASAMVRVRPSLSDPTNEELWEAQQKSIVETLKLNFPVKL